ncbi:hypothetical protein BT63DRAFT_153470 [Microthyrium microscopicum]|uniref:Transcription factor IIIC subunit 5 HTH domain-containing protein n=1 Tax=Microthyrium microscopicum TaxID=703497 RepID=A0A6A6UPF0_9PEZI|nr:hypothetical protein BT63DRAFT_153470 [Microthyrium microscopicum]
MQNFQQMEQPAFEDSQLVDLVPVGDAQIISLEHPCRIHNVDRGVKSLGGHTILNKFLDSSKDWKSRKPHISLRPEDAFATKLPSFYNVTNNVVLKITVPKRTGRKRKRGSDHPFEMDADWPPPKSGLADAAAVHRSIRDNEKKYSYSPVGEIRHTYRFRTITSFQHATVGNPVVKRMKKTLLSSDYETVKQFGVDPSPDLAPTAELHPPPGIALTELPFPFYYRQNENIFVQTDPTGAIQSVNLDHQMKSSITKIGHDAPTVPTTPPPNLPKEYTLDPYIRQVVKALRNALKDRPILSTRVQSAASNNAPFGNIRRAIPYCGYMFREGPFKNALIRYGVDPRSDTKYRDYQLVHVHVQPPDKSKVWYSKDLNKDITSSNKQDAYKFDGTTVSMDHKVWQACDVSDPLLRSILDNSNLCDTFETTTRGWYKSGVWSIFRVLLKDKIDRIVHGTSRDDAFYKMVLEDWPENLEDYSIDPSKRLSQDPDIASLRARARTLGRQAELTGATRKRMRKDFLEGGDDYDEDLGSGQESAVDDSDLDEVDEVSDQDDDEFGAA